MAGVLSNIFGSDEGQDGTGSDGSVTTANTDTSELGAHADLNPTVSLHTEFSGSYQDLDGTTHEWSNESDLTVSLDVHAAIEFVGETTSLDTQEG